MCPTAYVLFEVAIATASFNLFAFFLALFASANCLLKQIVVVSWQLGFED